MKLSIVSEEHWQIEFIFHGCRQSASKTINRLSVHSDKLRLQAELHYLFNNEPSTRTL